VDVAQIRPQLVAPVVSTPKLLVILAVTVAACSEPASTPARANGGTLVVSVGGDPETLLPPLASTTTAQVIGDLVYDRLAEIGDSLNTVGDEGFRPRLAKSWTWAPDSLSITFEMDPRARWHDGKPVTARDVAFTYKVYTDSANGSPFVVTLAGIDSVTAPDSAHAVIWFNQRSPMQFYDAVNTMLILPQHVLGDLRGPALRASSLSRTPLGSGRFRFEKWNAAQSIELVADTSNYRGRPGLDRFIVTIAPDFNTAVTRLLGGEADMLEQVPASSLADLVKDTSIRITLRPGLDYNFVQLNLNDPKHAPRPHRIFADRALRRALTMALDRKSIVQNAYDSLAAVAIGPTVRAYPTTDTTLAPLPFSRDSAIRILDSLGWKDTNRDGVRDRNGTPLEFSLVVPSSSKSRNTMAVLIQEQLRQVGVKVNIEPLDLPSFIDRETRRDFDAVIGGWHVEPSPGGIRQTWGTAGADAPRGTNYGSYRNRAFDAQVDSALSAATFGDRRAHFTAAYRIIIDDAPAIWLAEPHQIMAVHKRIRTVGVRPDAWWANVADWSIPESERIARDRVPVSR
jgi:peptide/nickel transport system substrate-binding protein